MGEVNHLKAFIALLRLAHMTSSYDYYHLTTGQDAFVHTSEDLDKFIAQYPEGISFIEAYKIPHEQYATWESGWGIFDYYMFSDMLNYNLKSKWGARMYGWTKKIHHVLHIRRKRPAYTTYIGSIYCSLSELAVKKIMKSALSIPLLRRLRFTLCGEGVYFQTLLMNEECPICCSNLTYVDWSSSSDKPKLLDETDWGKWGDGKFFIRKIDSQRSKALLSKLLL